MWVKYILFTFYLLGLQEVSAEGLRFFGREYPINQRTSYNVFEKHPVSFSGNFEIAFDLTLYVTSHIGNIVRVKANNDDVVFNLFYNGHGKDQLFLLNEEGRSNLISISLDKSDYPPRQWLTIRIGFDLRNDAITLSIGDQTYKATGVSLDDKFTPTIVFGRSDHIIDVPLFAIRNLSIGNNREYTFLLNEYQGNTEHDIRGREMGSVTNPDWLINDSYHWKLEAQFSSPTVSGTNYHNGRDELYYFNRDSIIIFDMRSRSSRTVVFETRCPLDPRLGTNFIDWENDRLYCYEVFYTDSEMPTVVSLDLNSFEWRIESYDRLPIQLHHHASYFDSAARQYMIFGGFGNRRFSNEFYQYDLDKQEWTTYPVEGEITPRYFTSLGHSEGSNLLYLFGGTGNISGNQLLGRE